MSSEPLWTSNTSLSPLAFVGGMSATFRVFGQFDRALQDEFFASEEEEKAPTAQPAA
jgi:hypothetical protein